MEKALKFAEKMAKKEEKFREVNEREKVLKRIFKEVDDMRKKKKQDDDLNKPATPNVRIKNRHIKMVSTR